MSDRDIAKNILRALGGALTEVSPIATGPWRVALGGVGAAVSFVGELLAHDMDPVLAIAEIVSVLPDYQAAKSRLQRLVDEKSAK